MGCAIDASGIADPDDASFMRDGKADATGIEEGELLARATLRWVNGATVEDIASAGIARDVAELIVLTRQGDDERAGTSDDLPYVTLAQLDAVPRVGPTVFAALLAKARTKIPAPPATCANPRWTETTLPDARGWNAYTTAAPLVTADDRKVWTAAGLLSEKRGWNAEALPAALAPSPLGWVTWASDALGLHAFVLDDYHRVLTHYTNGTGTWTSETVFSGDQFCASFAPDTPWVPTFCLRNSYSPSIEDVHVFIDQRGIAHATAYFRKPEVPGPLYSVYATNRGGHWASVRLGPPSEQTQATFLCGGEGDPVAVTTENVGDSTYKVTGHFAHRITRAASGALEVERVQMSSRVVATSCVVTRDEIVLAGQLENGAPTSAIVRYDRAGNELGLKIVSGSGVIPEAHLDVRSHALHVLSEDASATRADGQWLGLAHQMSTDLGGSWGSTRPPALSSPIGPYGRLNTMLDARGLAHVTTRSYDGPTQLISQTCD